MIFGTEHELQRDDITMSQTVQAARAVQLGNLQCIYYEMHVFADHIDWSQAEKARLPNLRPPAISITLR
jgi:hypothetical protein